MNQLYLRKLHKTIGVVLAFFIFLQAGSGLFLSFAVNHSHAHTDAVTTLDKHEEEPISMVEERAIEPEKDVAVVRETEAVIHDHEDETEDSQSMLQSIHHGGGFVGSIYRIILASGFLFMAFSGSLIFYLTRKTIRQ
jgi:hypothetical protein